MSRINQGVNVEVHYLASVSLMSSFSFLIIYQIILILLEVVTKPFDSNLLLLIIHTFSLSKVVLQKLVEDRKLLFEQGS